MNKAREILDELNYVSPYDRETRQSENAKRNDQALSSLHELVLKTVGEEKITFDPETDDNAGYNGAISEIKERLTNLFE